MSKCRLSSLAKKYNEEKARYIACDPASPDADMARAGEIQQALKRLIFQMAQCTNFDMTYVSEAIDLAATGLVEKVRRQGYYTEVDLLEIRRSAIVCIDLK